MFDIGFIEILTFGTICLLVLGPERLPHAARVAGGLLGKSRRAFHDLKHTIELEINAKELQERIQNQTKQAQDTIQATQDLMNSELIPNDEADETIEKHRSHNPALLESEESTESKNKNETH